MSVAPLILLRYIICLASVDGIKQPSFMVVSLERRQFIVTTRSIFLFLEAGEIFSG